MDVDYEVAAEYSNLCRKHGIQGSHADLILCAVAVRSKMKIYTNNKDFRHYSEYLALELHEGN